MITFTRIGSKVRVDQGDGSGVILDIVYDANNEYIHLTKATSMKAPNANGLRFKISNIKGRPSDVSCQVAEWLCDNFFYKNTPVKISFIKRIISLFYN